MPHPSPKLAQARELIAQGRLEQARTLLLRLVQADPQDAHAANLLSAVLSREGNHPQALFYAERAAALVPGQSPLLVTLGNLLCLNGRHAEGIRVLEQAIGAAPHDPEAWVSWIKGSLQARDLAGAVAACERAEREEVFDPGLTILHAACLQAMGRIGEAIAALRRGTERFPGSSEILSDLAFTMNFDHAASPQQVLEAHRRYGQALGQRLEPLPPPAWDTTDPERRLRLGLVSADLREHSVARFLEPLLEKLDRTRFEVFCYHTATRPDETTARFRRLTGGWREVPTQPAHELARLIRADRVDIAIDLSGHSQAHRLAAFHLRVAPVQATFLGYANTTGVETVDWRMVDSLTDPPGSEGLMVERPLRIDPCFLCYRPPREAPAVAQRPPGAPIVFGSFSAIGKINDAVLEAWAAVLRGVPGSRLVLKNQSITQQPILERFRSAIASRGLDPGRLEALPWATSTPVHLAAYAGIDIALDTFPYNGTTTTCEALHMGVPVVTLAGQTHAGRVGLSLLTAVGMQQLVGREPGHYVAIAVALASDRGAMATLRGALRERLRTSVLCDEGAYAARFGAAMRKIWRERCAARAG
jgi:predicted O-linked N-acetylglucosamine transferase (SPINDLY family)